MVAGFPRLAVLIAYADRHGDHDACSMRAPFVKLWTRLIRKFSLAESSQNQLPADEEVNAQDVVDRRGVYGVLLYGPFNLRCSDWASFKVCRFFHQSACRNFGDVRLISGHLGGAKQRE